MAVPGQRFTLDLSPDAEPGDEMSRKQDTSWSGIRDITERFPSSVPQPPRAPTTPSSTGFPAHKKRTKPSSAFRRQRDGAIPNQRPPASTTPDIIPTQEKQPPNPKDDEDDFETTERKRIDEENRQRLAAMTDEEIQHEQKELLEHLSPALVERLRTRLNRNPKDEMDDREHPPSSTLSSSSSSSSINQPPHSSSNYDPEAPPRSPPSHLFPATITSIPPVPRIHFPAPPLQPNLDPSAPDFLAALHEKYYPDLPPDPSKLAWMTPISPEDADSSSSSSYSPHLTSFAPSAIRFDFKGNLLAPRTARAIPVAEGLHHHGDAPEAAGYTIPELARLARSSFPAQRCIAYQTLGRIMFRLGKGGFGDEGNDLVMGLWRCLEEGRVLETLHAEAGTLLEGNGNRNDEIEGGDGEMGRSGGGHHASAKALAVEALWNWQRGGGKRWKAQ